jgi:hypothetical protein
MDEAAALRTAQYVAQGGPAAIADALLLAYTQGEAHGLDMATALLKQKIQTNTTHED